MAHPGTWLESKNTITDNAIFGRILLGEFALTPVLATGIFMIACWGGYQYRRVWKAGGPRWKLTGSLTRLAAQAKIQFTGRTSDRRYGIRGGAGS